MNEISKAFNGGKALIGFITGGDPSIEKSKEFAISMCENGVDILEIGIPFSDPIAEGEVIENANIRALKAGATTDKIFEMVADIRKKVSTPIILLTYINPVFVYGVSKFFYKCKLAGVNGVIIPDLPFEETAEISNELEKYGITNINIVAPTSENRISKICKNAKGFVYVVSSLGVTGERNNITTNLKQMVDKIREVTDTPVAIGFGIKDKEMANNIAQICDGVIIGSKIVKIIQQENENAAESICKFTSSIKAELEKTR